MYTMHHPHHPDLTEKRWEDELTKDLAEFEVVGSDPLPEEDEKDLAKLLL